MAEAEDCNGGGKLYFKGLNILFINAGLVKARANILKKQLEKFGGNYSPKYDPKTTTHILTVAKITQNTVEKELTIKYEDIHCPLLNVEWISMCLTESKLLPILPYMVRFKTEINKPQIPTPLQLKPEIIPPKPIVAPPELYPMTDILKPVVLGKKRDLIDDDNSNESEGRERDGDSAQKYIFPHVFKGKNTAGIL